MKKAKTKAQKKYLIALKNPDYDEVEPVPWEPKSLIFSFRSKKERTQLVKLCKAQSLQYALSEV